ASGGRVGRGAGGMPIEAPFRVAVGTGGTGATRKSAAPAWAGAAAPSSSLVVPSLRAAGCEEFLVAEEVGQFDRARAVAVGGWVAGGEKILEAEHVEEVERARAVAVGSAGVDDLVDSTEVAEGRRVGTGEHVHLAIMILAEAFDEEAEARSAAGKLQDLAGVEVAVEEAAEGIAELGGEVAEDVLAFEVGQGAAGVDEAGDDTEALFMIVLQHGIDEVGGEAVLVVDHDAACRAAGDEAEGALLEAPA